MTARALAMVAVLLAACARDDSPPADEYADLPLDTVAAPARIDSVTSEIPPIDSLPPRSRVPSVVAGPPRERDESRDGPSPGSAERERMDELARLEARVRVLAVTDGCTVAAQCATIAIGAKPCGGPRGYLAYCAAATDRTALRRAADALRTAEERYNRRNQISGTCDVTPDPGASMQGGRCALGADMRLP